MQFKVELSGATQIYGLSYWNLGKFKFVTVPVENVPIVEEFNPMPDAKLWLQKHHNADDLLRGRVKKTKQTPSTREKFFKNLFE